MNSIQRGVKEPHDIQVYDMKQCFDNLWLEECINKLYTSGFQNDRLSLLYLTNKNAQIAVKTASGVSRERRSVNNIIMQGTVWGTIKCTNTMDKLGKLSYENPYKYKGIVEVPMLGMVDDVLNVAKCSNQAIISKENPFKNSLIDLYIND